MVFFNTVEVIEVVHHQADRLMQSFFAEVRSPVNGAQAGTVTKVESCDGIDGNIACPFVDEVSRAEF